MVTPTTNTAMPKWAICMPQKLAAAEPVFRRSTICIRGRGDDPDGGQQAEGHQRRPGAGQEGQADAGDDGDHGGDAQAHADLA